MQDVTPDFVMAVLHGFGQCAMQDKCTDSETRGIAGCYNVFHRQQIRNEPHSLYLCVSSEHLALIFIKPV